MNEQTTLNAGAYYEAQRSVIGAAVIDSRCIPEIMSALREEDFSLPEYRTLFAAVRALWMDHKPVDPVTLLDAVGKGYRDLVTEAMKFTPTAANVGAYCRIVREEALYLQIRDLAETILETRQLGDALPLLHQAESLAAGNRQIREVTIQEALAAAYRRASETRGDWIDWGLSKLTDVLQIPPGKFVVLAADSSVGKTALALQLAWNIGRSRRTAFYSIETDDETLADRTVAQRVGIDLGRIQRRQIEADQWKDWSEIGSYAGKVDLRLVDASAMSLQQIRAHILTNGIQVAFIDYVQMLDAPGRDTADKVRAISLALHKMSQDLRCTVVGLSQLTVPPDAPNKWVPKLENLRESRQLKNDADVVMLLYLHRRSQRDGGRWLSVAKNKEGRLGRIYLRYDGPHMFFYQAEPPVEKDDKEKEAAPPAGFTPLPDNELDPMDEEVLKEFETHPRPN